LKFGYIWKLVVQQKVLKYDVLVTKREMECSRGHSFHKFSEAGEWWGRREERCERDMGDWERVAEDMMDARSLTTLRV